MKLQGQREHFEMRTHKRLIAPRPTPKTWNALMRIDLTGQRRREYPVEDFKPMPTRSRAFWAELGIRRNFRRQQPDRSGGCRETGPCVVTQRSNAGQGRYSAVQLAYGGIDPRKVTSRSPGTSSPRRGHPAPAPGRTAYRAGQPPTRWVREVGATPSRWRPGRRDRHQQGQGHRGRHEAPTASTGPRLQPRCARECTAPPAPSVAAPPRAGSSRA